MTSLKQLGSRVRERRKALRLTQKEVAALAERHWTTVGDIEAGRPGVRLGNLASVLHVLGLEIDLIQETRGD